MNDINQLIIEGEITEDCKITVLPNVLKVAEIQIETKRNCKKIDGSIASEENYFTVKAYGESFCSMLERKAKKGGCVRIVGRIKQERWLGYAGQQCSKIVIIAEHIDFIKLSKEA